MYQVYEYKDLNDVAYFLNTNYVPIKYTNREERIERKFVAIIPEEHKLLYTERYIYD